MSNFWANRLGTQPAAQPAPPPPAPSNQPWWAPRQAPAPVQQQPQAPAPMPQAQPQQGSVAEDGQAHFGDLLRQEEYTSTKAQSARDSERCPDCDSANYVADKTNGQSMKHCFDCGYNPRFSQSMAGMSGTGQNIPVKTARVQSMNTNSFDPSVIVGHVG